MGEGGGKAPVDTSMLTFKCATEAQLREAGLLDAAPANAKYNVGVMGTYVESQDNGGKDKVIGAAAGLRFDTPGILNGLIKQGINAQLLPYQPAEHDAFMECVKKFDACIIRINPGQITAQGGDQQKFDKDVTDIIAGGVPIWPSPETMEKMGAKDALCMVKEMEFGLPDTLGYYSPEDMKAGFPKSIAFQPRVVKQNRGSAGEGIWIIKLKEGNYCEKYGDRVCEGSEMLILKEANDFHEEEHTVDQFMEFCINGRTDASGEWTSIGTGKYYEGGVEAGGQMVDQRMLPRIDEGEARFVMIGKELKQKMENEMGDYLTALKLGPDALPLLWAADFIPVDGHICHHVIGEFNCSCLGIAGFLNSRGKDLKDMTPDDAAMGGAMADLIGQICFEALEAKK